MAERKNLIVVSQILALIAGPFVALATANAQPAADSAAPASAPAAPQTDPAAPPAPAPAATPAPPAALPPAPATLAPPAPRPAPASVADLAAAGEPFAIRLGTHGALIPRLQYRPRFLWHEERDLKQGSTFDAFSHRARLGFEARAFGWLSAMIQVQDVRRWGEELNTLNDFSADGFDVHQAWAAFQCACGLSIRLGRQELAFDNQRLIGAVDFADQGRVFDAVRVTYEHVAGFDADLFYAKVAEQDAYAEDPGSNTPVAGGTRDIDLVGLHARYSKLAAFSPALIALFDRGGANDRKRVTAGLFAEGKPTRCLTYNAEIYFQVGSQQAAVGAVDLGAFLAAGRVIWSPSLPGKPFLAGWFEFLSGDDDASSGTVTTFDTLYATNHKFYGFMDFFTDIPGHTGGFGLVDAGGRLGAKPLAGFLAFVDYHHFRQATGAPGGASAALGDEIDFLVRYELNRHLALEGVFGVLVPRAALSALRNGGDETERFAYLQLDLQL